MVRNWLEIEATMHLVTFSTEGRVRVGVLMPGDGVVVDLSAGTPALPADMSAFVLGGTALLDAAREAVRSATAEQVLPLGRVSLLAPIQRPLRDLMCVGKNYREHAKEFHGSGFDATAGADAVPEDPIIFTKATTSVIGPGETIPAGSDPTASVDYEGELAVVIGKPGRNIAARNAFDHVYGYTVVNDVTSRTLQKRHKQWFLGKSLDGFCPMGPALVTADEIPDVSTLRLVTRVNGEVRQDASVSDLIFDIPTLIEVISASVTLLPGDIIATGTPAGVGIGFTPPRFLSAGDVVSVTIDGIGTLENPVG